MQLSKRLLALAEMVSEGNVLVDVGCDHGYLPIYLIQNHHIPKAIAMDIGKGPLERAKDNIKAHGLEGYIETRLSDGLEKLRPGEGDTLLISGMGGPLIQQILSRGEAEAVLMRELILQPQSDIPGFRKYLSEEGYEILDENIIYEDGKFYPMMKASRRTKRVYTPLEYRYGPVLLKKRHPILREYLVKEAENLRMIQERLRHMDSGKASVRLEEIKEEMQLVQAALETYE